MTLKTIIKFSFIGVIIGLIIFLIKPVRNFGLNFMLIALWLGQLTGLILYLSKSNIFKSVFFKIIIIGIAVFIIGVLFKIQHWVGSSIIILSSLVIIFLTYLVRFLSKSNKLLVDYVKVIWLLFAFSAYYFRIMHWHFADFLLYSSYTILWLGLLNDIYFDYHTQKRTT
jgi:hypothetical protein